MINTIDLHSRIKEFFPYPEIRDKQKILISSILSSFKQNKISLIIASNGIGKTISTLSAVLTYIEENKQSKKIFYLTRTHNQADRVIEELYKIKNENYIGLALRSAQNLCINEEVLENTTPTTFNFVCQNKILSNQCKYYNQKLDIDKLVEDLVFSHVDAETLIEESKSNMVCPKIVSNRLLKEVDILVGSYNYIFDNTIRKNIFQQLNISYNDIIIIIDEAHNLPNTVLQLYSESISTSTISKAIKELDHVINQYLLLLKNYMRFEKEDKKIDILEVLQIIDTKIGFNLDIELIRDYKRQSENDQKRKKKNFSYSSIVASFLEFLLNSIASPDYSYFLQIMGNNPKLSIIAQDSSLRIRNIIKKVNRVVLASGTMSKIDLLNFGIATSEIRVGKVEAEYPNLHCIVPKGINTSYQNRNAIMYTKIESVIGKILQIKQNTGIFFTSYEMMKKFIPKIQSSKRNTYLIDQNITARDTENMVNSFKKAKDHVLVSVIRGRISEGIDFPAEEMEIIIIIGIPYPHRDIIMTERIDYFEKKFNKQIAENLVYYTDTFSSFIQTTGRAIRSETDRANIFILDDRIMNQKNRLPKYIQDSLISVDDIQLDSIIKKIDNKDW